MSTTEDELTRLYIEGQRRLDENRRHADRGATFIIPEPPQMPEDGSNYPASGSKPEEPLQRLRRANRGSTCGHAPEQPLADDELGGHTRDSFNRLPAERSLQIVNRAFLNRMR